MRSRAFLLLPLALMLAVAGDRIGFGQVLAGAEKNPVATATGNDMGNVSRVGVDRPKPVFMLSQRDPRVHGLRPFQALVDAAPAGSVLKPPPGQYAGPVAVTKPLVIDGGGKVTIDAGDRGTVFSLETSGATLRGLHLTGSGNSHDTDDSCLDVRGDRNVIEKLTVDNCLFGIDLKQSNDNIVRGNTVRSKPFELGMRGDGIRLWYSRRNLIEGNQVTDSRDMVAWYSHGNMYRNNVGQRSRYSLHFMFANDNVVEGNRFYDNTVGVYLMYTERGVIRNNVISHATGAAGMAIGFKESSGTLVEGNTIIYCAVGIGSDLSPFQPGSKITIRNNRIAYNGIGILFNSELGGNEMLGNDFEGNITHVAYGAGRAAVERNVWNGNYWDDYQGFDRNHDGVGDTPYEILAFADSIWMEMPEARFFKSSPAMELLDFLERLAPFSTPDRLVKDDAPRFQPALPREGS
ncbi:MAG: nitrous oxide reductase family maturation protein NosD [Burkholderiaceae bacterium]|jgi:nitrous oxidase accessory protein|nr:nitrous oxide reductase family maturation protein NosD [Burkholderiaceae bacterium]